MSTMTKNILVSATGQEVETLQISDGYHTFDELYEHRYALFVALCKVLSERAWRSERHSDGSRYDGYFLLGVNKSYGKQITYHLPMKYWMQTDFVRETLPCAPEYDGHSPAEVLRRLRDL